MQTEIFKISGMSCSACANHIHKQVAALHGVDQVQVNLLKNAMAVTFNNDQIGTDAICSAVRQLGYEIRVDSYSLTPKMNPEKYSSNHASTLRILKQRLYGSLFFSVILCYLSLSFMLGWPLPAIVTGTNHILGFIGLQFLLLAPVVILNIDFYINGLRALIAKNPNMNSLVAIGSGAAIIFGIYTATKILFAPDPKAILIMHQGVLDLYFDSAAMILTLITLGKFFESRSKQKTTAAITKLIDLLPKTAILIQPHGEICIPLDQVRVNDLLVIKAGEQVPVDGIIIEGTGWLDESAITGESLPRKKHENDSVTGATLNYSGYFIMRATHVGQDTTLAQIIKLVDAATSTRAPMAQLADKVSAIFVPIVILIAAAATATWLVIGYDVEFALMIGISVLVISCPCALGLATPTAIMVASGQGAAQGVLFKSAQAIETTGKTDIVVLDKTGTITEGRPSVISIISMPFLSKDDLLELAASLEKLSEHPLGHAIVTAAKDKALTLRPVTAFSQLPGYGITGNIGGTLYSIGNAKLLQQQNIDNLWIEEAEMLANEGKTVLYFTGNNQLLGAIALTDKIKESSYTAIAALKRMGICVLMLTGDNIKNALYVRKKTHIHHVIADVLPQDKEKEIRRLQAMGKNVIMVGDGINDAPALARANVGMAIGAGTDIAIESADVVLVKNDLQDVVMAIELSKATLRNIKQNLFWAFSYNIIGIPIAAGVFYSAFGILLNPMIAAAAMSFSSICVVTNALRLRFFKPKKRVG